MKKLFLVLVMLMVAVAFAENKKASTVFEPHYEFSYSNQEDTSEMEELITSVVVAFTKENFKEFDVSKVVYYSAAGDRTIPYTIICVEAKGYKPVYFTFTMCNPDYDTHIYDYPKLNVIKKARKGNITSYIIQHNSLEACKKFTKVYVR